MSRHVVCDASALIALLLDGGDEGRWVTQCVTGSVLAAPSLVWFETANILRRHEMAGLVSPDQAAQAHADLIDLAIESWPYELIGLRSWQLRSNLTSHDASYVAVAELLEAPLVTLDRRIASAPGLRCDVFMPPRG